MSPDEVLEKHSSRQLTEWEEEYKLNPFGEESALLVKLCVQFSNGLLKKQDGSKYTDDDFCKRKKTDDELDGKMNALATSLAQSVPKAKTKKKK